MKKLKVVILGCGGRGTIYAKHMNALADKYEIIGAADPDVSRLDYMRETYHLDDKYCFPSWTDALALPKFADLVVISTMDEMHYEPAMRAIDLGYDILLEKPISPTAKECADIAKAANEKGVRVIVCHVLRYTPFYKSVKRAVDAGLVGDILSVIASESVGHVHQSHSFVRGNWHSEEETAPMLLAKSCHDLDIIQWLVGKRCKKVTSFGDLTYFTPANAPDGAPIRCIDGGCPVADTCVYNCRKLYYDDKNNQWFRGACTKNIAKGHIPTDDEVMQALQTTDYGLCVFHANNDVVDHQIVNMLFEGTTTVSFSMNAFNSGGRYIRLFGTKGELRAYEGDKTLGYFSLEKREWQELPIEDEALAGRSGHGGGDAGIVYDLYDYLTGQYKGYSVADISISAANHLIGFAAERARHTDTVVELDPFFEEYGLENK